MPQGRLKRIWKWTWRSTAVLLVLIYLGRNAVVAPFVIKKAQPAIAEALGMELEIVGVSGSWFGGIGLQRIHTLTAGQKTPLKGLELRDLVVDYSLWGLIRGDPDWLKGITCKELAVDLDMLQTTAAPEVEPEIESSPTGLPDYLPPVQIEKLTVAYWDGEVRVEIPAAKLQSEFTVEHGTSYALISANNHFERAEQLPPDFDLQLTTSYSDGKLEVAGLAINGVNHVHTGWADLSEVHLGALAFDFDLSLMDGQVTAKGNLKDQQLSAAFTAKGLHAETLNPWLDLGLRGELDVEATADVPLNDPRAGRVSVTFGAQQNGWNDFELHAIDGVLELANGWLRTDSFQANGEGLQFSAKAVKLPLFAPEGQWEAEGSFSLVVDDLPTWIKRSGAELPPEVELLQHLDLNGALVSHPGGLRVELRKFELGTQVGNLNADGEVDLALDGVAFQGLAGESPLRLNAKLESVNLVELLEQLSPEGVANPLKSGALDFEFALQGPPNAPTLLATAHFQNVLPTQAIPDLPQDPFQGRVEIAYADGKLLLKPTQVGSPQLDCALEGEYDLRLDLNELIAGSVPDLDGKFAANVNLKIDNPAWIQGQVQAQTQIHGAGDSSQFQAHVFSEQLLPPADLQRFLGAESELGPKLAAVSLNQLNLNLTGGWKGKELLPLQLSGDCLGLDPGGHLPLDLTWDVALADGGLNLKTLRLTGEALRFVANANVPLDLNSALQNPEQFEIFADGPLQIAATLGEVDFARLRTTLGDWVVMPEVLGDLEELHLAVSGNWQNPVLEARLRANGIHTPVQQDSLLPDPADFGLHAKYEAGVATVHELYAKAPQFELEGGGTWNGELNLARLANGSPLEPGTLAMTAHLNSNDLTWLAATGAVRRAAGELGVDVKIDGAANQPDVTATLLMNNCALRLNDPTVAAIEHLNLQGEFADGILNIASMHGELGSAPFDVTGTVDLLHEVEPQLDMKLSGSDLLLFRQQGVKLRSDADLHIHGALSSLKASGEIELTDGRYTRPVDFFLPLLKEGSPPSAGVEGISLFSLPPPLDKLQFDVTIKPGSGFRVKTNVANGLIQPNLRMLGTGEVPFILGEVYLDSFLISLPVNRLRIDRGLVRFLEENPFIPTLDINAGFERFGYDVTVLISGDLSAPEITLTSIPPLAAEELLVLTLTGQPPAESIDAESALGTVAIYLAKDWIRRFFGDMSTEEEESLLDRLEIEFGRDSTQQGAETIEGRFLLRKNNLLENDALFLTGEQDAYGDFNLGLRIRFLFP